MQNMNPQINLLFETSWEVCNKVGGIYTVLSTKAKELHDVFGDRLIFIGPEIPDSETQGDLFTERKSLLKKASEKMELPFGISIRIGRWNVPGKPVAVLIRYEGVYDRLDDIFGEMWKLYGVDSLHAYGDYRESCAFAVASAIVIESLTRHLGVDPVDVEAHFDEWTTGMGLLYLKTHQPQMATLFTTHATSIGRSICSNGKLLYDYFDKYDGDQMAHELNMESKHSLEKAAAHQADCFTTVSEVTARECSQLLERKPDVVTPNGFEMSLVPGARKEASLRMKGREKLLRIASLLTGDDWKDKETFIVATSGRHEYRNKGIDMFLDAVAATCEFKKKILALVLVPGWVKEPSGDLIMDLGEDAYVKPSVDFITHTLNNFDSDEIVAKIREIESRGRDGNKAIVYIPCYLDGYDGIVDISYYDLLPAVDLTVFPSYYEPWGYTPLESIAFGIPTITTDKSGFGQWVLSNFGKDGHKGIYVVDRTDSNYQECVGEIATFIVRESGLTGEEIDGEKENVKRIAQCADWKHFINSYFEAFRIAARHRDERLDREKTNQSK